MEKPTSPKHKQGVFSILVGDGIEHGDAFCVVGRVGSMREARQRLQSESFIREHVRARKNGAYVLVVSTTGHHVMLPLPRSGKAD